MDETEDLGNIDDLEDEDVFVPIRASNRSADYYEETQRSFHELRLKMEEDSAIARQAMDRELEKLHRLFFRQDMLGTRERHYRRQRRRPAVSDTSSSSDTDTMTSSVRSRPPHKPRSSSPGPRLHAHSNLDGVPRDSKHCKVKGKQDNERDRKRLCQNAIKEPIASMPGHDWTSKSSKTGQQSNMSG